MTGDWIFTNDEEWWADLCRYPTREAAVQAAPVELGLRTDQVFWTGRRVQPTVVTPSGYELLEQLRDAKCDEDGSDRWLTEVTTEERRDLTSRIARAVEDWLAAHPRHRPTWFIVENVEEHVYRPAPEEAQA